MGSFLGVMLDPAHKNLWTQSLMWAMLSCVILAPVFIFVGTSGDEPPPPEYEPEPFEEPEERTEAAPSPEEDGWPYTSEQEETESNGPGPVTQES